MIDKNVVTFGVTWLCVFYRLMKQNSDNLITTLYITTTILIYWWCWRETYTSDRSWQKKSTRDIISVVTSLKLEFSDYNINFAIFVCKIHAYDVAIWWCRKSSFVEACHWCNLAPISLVEPLWVSISNFRPVYRIYGMKFMIMKPIVNFFFCQNLLRDKVTWWLNNNGLFYLTLCFCILIPAVSWPLAANPLENFRNSYIKKFL